jgi:uncharacterized membrane protein YeaQ/YmgE (transglycosylase-associated protein family)
MTGELLLVSVIVGLFGGWVFGLVMGKGKHGVLGDLCLGLAGGPIAVWIYQAVGLAVYAGIVGGMVAAFMGAVGVVFAQRRLRYVGV